MGIFINNNKLKINLKSIERYKRDEFYSFAFLPLRVRNRKAKFGMFFLLNHVFVRISVQYIKYLHRCPVKLFHTWHGVRFVLVISKKARHISHVINSPIVCCDSSENKNADVKPYISVMHGE